MHEKIGKFIVFKEDFEKKSTLEYVLRAYSRDDF
jgi:hypothetical protein